jgi:hypothetical protein
MEQPAVGSFPHHETLQPFAAPFEVEIPCGCRKRVIIAGNLNSLKNRFMGNFARFPVDCLLDCRLVVIAALVCSPLAVIIWSAHLCESKNWICFPSSSAGQLKNLSVIAKRNCSEIEILRSSDQTRVLARSSVTHQVSQARII